MFFKQLKQTEVLEIKKDSVTSYIETVLVQTLNWADNQSYESVSFSLIVPVSWSPL